MDEKKSKVKANYIDDYFLAPDICLLWQNDLAFVLFVSGRQKPAPLKIGGGKHNIIIIFV